MMEKETTFLRKELFYTPEKRHSRGGAVKSVLLGGLLALALTFSSVVLLSRIVVFPSAAHQASVTPAQPKKKLIAFVGVQTGFSAKHASPKYSYDARRKLLRETWFPSPKSALDKFEEEKGVRVRFVIGHTTDEDAERKLKAEQEAHNDFLRLDFRESYKGLAFKTLSFLRYVADNFDAQYIVKADDDIYLALPRLLLTVPQWKERQADYIGCMTHSKVRDSKAKRWYEPQHALLGPQYFSYAVGSIYVMSGQATEVLRYIPEGRLRMFNNEDTTVGGWMIALNVTHFDDRRLCGRTCKDHTLAVFNSKKCAGLCNMFEMMPRLHNNSNCQTLKDPLPMLEEAIPVSAAHSRAIQETKEQTEVVLHEVF